MLFVPFECSFLIQIYLTETNLLILFEATERETGKSCFERCWDKQLRNWPRFLIMRSIFIVGLGWKRKWGTRLQKVLWDYFYIGGTCSVFDSPRIPKVSLISFLCIFWASRRIDWFIRCFYVVDLFDVFM